MLDGSGSLTQEIKTLLENNQTQTATFASFTVGNSLSLQNVTLSFDSAQGSGDNWTGSVSVEADTASLTLGTGLSAAITAGSAGGPGFQGTYSLSGGDLASGAYQFSAGQFDLSVPNVLQASASSVHIAYDQSKPSGQDLVKIASLQATISPLNNLVATVSNLDIRDDGFSLDNGTVTTDSIDLGQILQATSPSITFANIAYTVGSPLTGTITAQAASASLFAGDSGFSRAGSSSTNDLTLNNFVGTYNLASNSLSLQASGAHLGLGKILAADATDITIAYDPNSASPVTVQAGSLMATSSLLSGVMGSITNLKVSSAGVSFSDATLTDADTLSLANVVQATGLTVKVRGFNYVAGSSNIAGTVSIAAASAALFPGQTAFSASVTGFKGSYDLGSNALSLQADEVDLIVGKILEAKATGVAIGWDGTSASVALAGATLSSPLFPGVSGTLQGVTANNAGLSIQSAELDADKITIGSVLDLSNFKIAVTGLNFTTDSASFTGGVAISAGSVALFTDQSAFHATVDGFTGSYDVTSSSLDLKADDVDVAIGKILDLKATGLHLSYDPSASPSVAFHADTFELTSPEIANVFVKGTSLDISSDGFSLGSATLMYDGTIHVGSILTLDQPMVTVNNLSYTRGASSLNLGGPIEVGASSVELAFGSGAVSTSVTGFDGKYDPTTQALSLYAESAEIKVGEALEVEITELNFNTATTSDGLTVSLSVKEAMVNLPKLGLSAKVSDLHVDNDGFDFGTLTLTLQGTVKVGSALQVMNPSVDFTGFSYSKQAGGHLDDIGFKADGITVSAGTTAMVSGKVITGTLSLQPDSLGHITLTADSVTVALSSYLKLSATDVAFDSDPATGSNIVSFGSVGATFQLPGGLTLGGTGTDFGINGDGKLVPGPNFGVSLTATNAGQLQWPSWLPIQIQHLGLQWSDFTKHPDQFTIDLSATVATPNQTSSTLNFSGFVKDAVIDVGLLENRQFPIVSLAGAGISVSGSIFGASVKGELFVDLLKVDANGNAIADGDMTTPVANRIFYGGIDAGLNIAGEAGFELRLGLSQLGPLDGFVQVEAPIILDPVSGLAITDLHAGIDFARSLPTITDPKDLAKNTGLLPPGKQSLLVWQTGLKSQVLNQFRAVNATGDPFAYLTLPMTIDGGATLYSAYATENAIQLNGDLQISTDGKLLLSGSLVLGTAITINAAAYLDLSQAAQGKASLLIYAQAPANLPILSAYGNVTFVYAKAPTAPSPGATTPQLGSGLQLTSTNTGQAQGISLDGSTFTVEFWARRASVGASGLILSQGNPPAGTGLAMGFDATNFYVKFGGQNLNIPSNDTDWHHWAVTFDKTTGILYKDGKNVAHQSFQAISGGGTTLNIGGFSGGLDEIRVWSVTQSASDIANNYQSTYPTSSNGLVADWRFEDGQTTSASDSSGNGHLLSLTGAPVSRPTIVTPLPATANTMITVKIGGEIDLTVPKVPVGLYVTGTVTFTASIGMSTTLDLQVDGHMGIKPLGDVFRVNGDVMLDLSKPTPIFYGGFLVNVGDLSILSNLGLTLGGIAALRFNTSTMDQSVTLQPLSGSGSVTLSLPKTSGSFYASGTASFTRGGQTWFDIMGVFYASFGTTTSGQPGPELDLFAQGIVQLGPQGKSLVDLNAQAFLQITSAGIAAEFNTTLKQSPILAAAHIDLSGSLNLLLNTTGTNVTFTAPNASDLGKGLKADGAGTTVNIPAAAPGSGTNVVTPYLEIDGSGGLNLFNGLTSSGAFHLLIEPGLLTLGLDEDLKLSIKSATLLSLHAKGGLTIDSTGVFGAIQLTTSIDNTAMFGFGFGASFLVELNSTGQAQMVATPGGPINLPANLFARIDAQGHLKIGALDIQGAFDFQGTTNSVSLAVAGSTQVGPLQLAVGGQLSFQPSGFYGLLQAGLSAPPVLPGFSLQAQFQFEINTTSGTELLNGFSINNTSGQITTNRSVSIPANTVQIQAGGHLSVGSLINLQGEFDFRLDTTGLSIGVDADLTSVMNTTFHLQSYTTTRAIQLTAKGLIIDAALNTPPGGFGLGGFSISASAKLLLNTGDASATGSLGDTLAAHSFLVSLNGSINVGGFMATGSFAIGVTNGVFEIDLKRLGFSIFNQTASLSGYLKSDGTFDLTGTFTIDITPASINLSVGGTISALFQGLLTIDVSNTGLKVYVDGYGYAHYHHDGISSPFVDTPAVDKDSGRVYYKAYVGVTNSQFEIDLSFSVDVFNPSFSFKIGSAPTPPSGYAVRSVLLPATAPAYSVLTTPTGFQGTVAGPKGYSTTVNGTSLKLGAPGAYTVTSKSGSSQTVQTVQVFDVAPKISSLNTMPIAVAGTAMTIHPTVVYSGPTTDLKSHWTVTRNGVLINAVTNADGSLSLKPATPSATQPDRIDLYNVSLTVDDGYGGMATSSGNFEVVDPTHLVVNSVSTLSTVGTLSLAQALAIVPASPSQTRTITFDPAMAGKTIFVTSTTPPLTTPTAATISTPTVIDATDAPGLTLNANYQSRFFFVNKGATLSLSHLNLIHGFSTLYGPDITSPPSISYDTYGDSGGGGAIDNFGVLNLIDCSLVGNQTRRFSYTATGNGSYNLAAYGGAIYNAGTLNSFNTTFAQNSVQGGDATPKETHAAKSGGNGQGGAIYNRGTLNLTNDTFAENTASPGKYATLLATGSSVYNAGGSAKVYNSIFDDGGTAATFDNFAPVSKIQGSNNQIRSAIGVALSIFPVQTSAMLGQLGDHGNGILTYSLAANSPAIDAGSNLVLTQLQDARGATRLIGSSVDLGAVERQAYVVTNLANSGAGSLRQVVAEDDDGSVIQFDPSLKGKTIVLTSGPINLGQNVNLQGPGADIPQGPGADSITISGNNQNSLFLVPKGVTAAISGLTLADGLASQGGAIVNSGNLTLTADLLRDNIAQGTTDIGAAGGAIENLAKASLTIVGSTFLRNQSRGVKLTTVSPKTTPQVARGGAIQNLGTLTATNTTFEANSALASYGPQSNGKTLAGDSWGGAVDNSGSATFLNSTFADNVVKTLAGIVGNTPGNHQGASVANEKYALTVLDNVIAAYGTGTEVYNDPIGTISGSNNLVTTSSGLKSGIVSLTSDPRLAPLDSNAVPTRALLPGSPAVDSGTNSTAPSTDARLAPRVVNGAVDLGAVEVQSGLPTASAGGPYVIRPGSPLALDGSGSASPAGLSLTYSWTISNGSVTYRTTGVRPTLDAATLQKAGLGVGTYQLTVTVDDGYGGQHRVTSAAASLVIAPVPQLLTLAISPGQPKGSLIDSVDVSFSAPITLATLTSNVITLSIDGGPDLLRGPLTVSLVAGTTSTYRISGLSSYLDPTAVGSNRYRLSVNGFAVSDSYGLANGFGTVGF